MKNTRYLFTVRAAITSALLAVFTFLGVMSVNANSLTKDIKLTVKQKPMAEIAAPASDSGSSTASSLAVATSLDRKDHKYQPDDPLTIKVEVTEDAYVWVLDTGTSGRVLQLFPNAYDSNNFVKAASPLVIPSKGAEYSLMVSNPPGAELITVIAMKENNGLTDQFIDSALNAGAFYAMKVDAESFAKDVKLEIKNQKEKMNNDSAVQHTIMLIE